MAISVVTNTGPFTGSQARVNGLVTGLVLGTQSPLGSAADMFFERVLVDSPTFQFRQYDNTRLVAHETRRAMSAPFHHAVPGGRLLEASVVRHSFAAVADSDEIKAQEGNGGDPFFQASLAALGKEIVDLGREVEAAEILTASGTYPAGHVLNITAGSEWNSAGGDSAFDITVAAAMITSKTAVGRAQLHVGLSESALAAALQDPQFKIARAYTNANYPDLEDLRKYWGVARVFSFNPIQASAAAIGIVPTPIFGDIAVVFVPMFNPSAFNLRRGKMVFAANFAWNQGVANTAFYLPDITSWKYPWTEWRNLQIISGAAGFLITNCAA